MIFKFIFFIILFPSVVLSQGHINLVIEVDGCVELGVSDFTLIVESSATNDVDTIAVNYRVGELIGHESLYEDLMTYPPQSRALIIFETSKLVENVAVEKRYEFALPLVALQQAYLYISLYNLDGALASRHDAEYLYDYITDRFAAMSVPNKAKERAHKRGPCVE